MNFLPLTLSPIAIVNLFTRHKCTKIGTLGGCVTPFAFQLKMKMDLLLFIKEEEVEFMQKTIKAYIHKGEKYYIAECLEIPVVTQGETIDEAVSNLQEAVSLHLEGEDLREFDLVSDPTLLITLEVEPSAHAA